MGEVHAPQRQDKQVVLHKRKGARYETGFEASCQSRQPLLPRRNSFQVRQGSCPDTDRFSTYQSTLSNIKTYEGMQVGCKVRYSSDQPLGKGKIGKYMKTACKAADLNFTGHGLRGIGISTFVNKIGSTAETLAYSHQKSVSGQKSYHRQNNKSEVVKFDALGVGGTLRNKPAATRPALPDGGAVGDNEPPTKKRKTNDSASGDEA